MKIENISIAMQFVEDAKRIASEIQAIKQANKVTIHISSDHWLAPTLSVMSFESTPFFIINELERQRSVLLKSARDLGLEFDEDAL